MSKTLTKEMMKLQSILVPSRLLYFIQFKIKKIITVAQIDVTPYELPRELLDMRSNLANS